MYINNYSDMVILNFVFKKSKTGFSIATHDSYVQCLQEEV